MMLGFVLDENGGRNGHCDKQRTIPSMIVQEFTAMHIYLFISSMPEVYVSLGCPRYLKIITNPSMIMLSREVGWSVRRTIVSVKALAGRMMQATFVA